MLLTVTTKAFECRFRKMVLLFLVLSLDVKMVLVVQMKAELELHEDIYS